VLYWLPRGDHVSKAAVQDAVGAFEVFEVVAPAAPMAPPHVSPWTGVLYLLEGRVTALVDGTSYDVEPGGVVVFPAGTPSTFDVGGESAPLRGGHLRRRRRALLRRLLRLRPCRPAGRGLDGRDPLGHRAARRRAPGRVSRRGSREPQARSVTLGDETFPGL
jgi:hypothetical protein